MPQSPTIHRQISREIIQRKELNKNSKTIPQKIIPIYLPSKNH